MTQIFSIILNVLRKAYKAFRLFYLFLIIILIILIIGGKHLWKEKAANKELQLQTQAAPTQPSDTTSPQDEKEDEEAEDDEADDEDSTADSTSPWILLETSLPTRYYEPAVKKGTPHIAIILTDIGLNKAWTDHILATVDKQITLVFSPYGPNITEQIQRATTLGYQTLVSLPMEPYSYPNPDPGPYTVLTGAKEADNINKTKLVLAKTPPGTGVIGDYGSRFAISKVDLVPVLKEVKNHGSVFIDPNTTLHSQIQNTCKTLDMRCFQVDLTLPASANLKEKDDFIKKIIQNSKENGIIIASVPAIPAFTNELPEWIDTFGKHNIKLVTIASLQTPELSLDASGSNQGTTNVNEQDSHQPR